MKSGSAQVFSPMMPMLSAFIIGDRQALTQLRDAIDEALSGAPEKVGLTRIVDSQGNPFLFIAAEIDTEHMGRLPSHYVDPAYRDPSADFSALETIPRVAKRLKRYQSALQPSKVFS